MSTNLIKGGRSYRWSVLENFVFLSQVFVEFENRRDVAATGKLRFSGFLGKKEYGRAIFFPSVGYNRELEHLPVAIVRSAPHSDDCLVEHQFVALHCELMCSGNEVNGIVMRKRFSDVCPKKKARSTRRKSPTSYIYVRK